MSARRAVGAALKSGDKDAEVAARQRVHAPKRRWANEARNGGKPRKIKREPLKMKEIEL
jgi:hypothetical protein